MITFARSNYLMIAVTVSPHLVVGLVSAQIRPA